MTSFLEGVLRDTLKAEDLKRGRGAPPRFGNLRNPKLTKTSWEKIGRSFPLLGKGFLIEIIATVVGSPRTRVGREP